MDNLKVVRSGLSYWKAEMYLQAIKSGQLCYDDKGRYSVCVVSHQASYALSICDTVENKINSMEALTAFRAL